MLCMPSENKHHTNHKASLLTRRTATFPSSSRAKKYCAIHILTQDMTGCCRKHMQCMHACTYTPCSSAPREQQQQRSQSVPQAKSKVQALAAHGLSQVVATSASRCTLADNYTATFKLPNKTLSRDNPVRAHMQKSSSIKVDCC
jgi:hypothetical protein